jgi:hypothetical protein
MELFAGRAFASFCTLLIAVAAVPALGQSTRPESSAAAVPVAAPAVKPSAKPPLEPGLFAKVNGKPVTQSEFHGVFSDYLRKKYYHGKVPDADLIKAREAVTEQIIDNILLGEEAVRRAIVPDAEEVERHVKRFEQQNANSPEWQRDRESLLPALRRQIEDQLKVKQLEKAVRDGASIAPGEVLTFYKANPELFTEPERLKLHTIVLGVDPSSSVSVWDAAMVEAAAIVKRIRGGASFAEIAQVVSSDPSSAQGGDMGYVHKGMIPDEVNSALASLPPGALSEPLRILQGVGIFRVDERTPARLREFSQVEERAKDLALRDKREQAWKSLLASLRSKAEVVLVDGRAAAIGTPNQ